MERSENVRHEVLMLQRRIEQIQCECERMLGLIAEDDLHKLATAQFPDVQIQRRIGVVLSLLENE